MALIGRTGTKSGREPSFIRLFWPGIEPGPPANMASALTTELPKHARRIQKLCCTGFSDPFSRAYHLKVKVVGLNSIWCLRQCYEAMNC